MPNINRVDGFKPSRYLNGAPYNGKVGKYVIPASNGTATFVGDLVELSGALDETTGLSCVVQADASSPVVGAVVGFEPVGGTSLGGDYMTTGNVALDVPIYRLASTRRIVYVADDPAIVFEAQEDGDTDPLEEEDASANVDFIVGSGSTTTGTSGMQIDSSTHAGTATLPLKLIGVVRRADNEWVTNGQAFTRWLVKINNHQLGSLGTTGI